MTTIAATALAATAPADAATAGRISGADRYLTSADIAAQFAAPAPLVWIAAGTNYPDGLSAAPAAAIQGGPLLLTGPTALPTSVATQLKRLKPKKIVVVGGTAAVGNAVVTQLKSYAPVTRLAGTDRFDTSRKIADYAFSGGASTAHVASGLNFPDALSTGGAAAKAHGPVLLVNGTAKSIDNATSRELGKLRLSSVTIAGGTTAVSSGIQSMIASRVAHVSRASGADRFATSVAINKAAFPSGTSTAYLASGSGFADALSGAALAGHKGSPLYVVRQNCIPSGTSADLTRLGEPSRVLLGGAVSLTAAVAKGSVCGAAPAKPATPPASSWYARTFGAKSYSGTGDDVVTLPAGAKAGIVTVSHTRSGYSNFIVESQDSAFNWVDLPVNEVGTSYHGTGAWGLETSDRGKAKYLAVTADGPWTITVKPMASAPVLPNSGSGDGAYRYDGAQRLWTLSNTDSSGSNFIMEQYAGTNAATWKLVANVLGTWGGRASNVAGPSMVLVTSAGRWTIK